MFDFALFNFSKRGIYIIILVKWYQQWFDACLETKNNVICILALKKSKPGYRYTYF